MLEVIHKLLENDNGEEPILLVFGDLAV